MPLWTDFAPAAIALIGLIAVSAIAAGKARTRRAKVAVAVAALGGCLALYAALIEPRTLTLKRVTVESAHWTAPPIMIAVLSDTHTPAPHMDAARLRRIVAATNALAPDLVVLLGDYVSGSTPASDRSARENARIAEGLAAFAGLNGPVAAVLGENDCYTDCAGFRTALEAAGAVVLWNEAVRIDHGAGVLVIGAGDDDTGDSDPAAALVDAPLLPAIGLTHSPDNFPDFPAPPRGPVIVLAGQTHCGQVRLPLIGALTVPSIYGLRYACGLVEEVDADGAVRRLYVGAGLGTSVLPVRFGAPPEIVLVTVRAPG
jgi:predicted MPP superfamily phosphohydrolase